MEAQTLRRHQAGSQFAGVQADVDLGINGVQVIQHLHLQRVIAHGDVTVLGLDEIDAHPRVIVHVHAGLHGLKAKQRLRKHLLWRKGAQHLVDVPDLNRTRRRGLLRSAMFQHTPPSLGLALVVAVQSYFVAESMVQQLLA